MCSLTILLVCLVIGIVAALSRISSRKRLERRRRYAAGKCMNCGYDIRINTHRCSECGGELVPQSIEYWREFVDKKQH